MKVWCFFLLLLVLRPTQAQEMPSASRQPLCIPFRYVLPTNSCMVVQVRVNDGPPLPFLLDTGANFLVGVEKWAADEALIKPVDQTKSITLGRQTVNLASDQKILIVGTDTNNSVEVPHIPLWVGDFNLTKASGEKLAGVIGMQLLELMPMQIDFEQQMLTFNYQSITVVQEENSFPLIRSSESAQYYVLCVPRNQLTRSLAKTNHHQPANALSDAMKLLLDTGASASTLPASVIAGLSPRAAFLHIATMVDGKHPIIVYLLPSLAKYGLGEGEVEVDTSNTSPDIAIGRDILSRFRVTLDFPHQLMILQPRSRPNQAVAVERGFVGFIVSNKNGYSVVNYVQQGSVAWKAGIQAGMKLLAVDGYLVNSASALSPGDIVDGKAGTTATFRLVDQRGREYDVKIKRSNEADPETFLAIGIRVIPAKFSGIDGVVVDAALCTSDAFKAGVRPGDQLLFVNGSPVAGKPLSDVEALLQKPVQTLTVRHLGEKTPQTLMLPTTKP